MTESVLTPNPKLDLVLERRIDVPRSLVWEAWTKPEHLKKWFTPKPWSVSHCEIDCRPGGIFHFVNRSPEGQEVPYTGCYLEVSPEERLIWTLALAPGFRPVQHRPGVPVFTAVITFESHGKGTTYTARAMHLDEAGSRQHAEMGFHEGWGAATDQLVALLTSGR